MAKKKSKATKARARAAGTLRGGKMSAKEREQQQIEDAMKDLTPEQVEMFLEALTLAQKKQKSMMLGYLCTIFALIVGSAWALYKFAYREPGEFIGWVFLVPIGAAGFFLWFFGRRSKRLGMTKAGSAATAKVMRTPAGKQVVAEAGLASPEEPAASADEEE